MIDLYVNLVINKKRTCDEGNKEVRLVPATLRDDVIMVLKEQGYDLNGNKVE